jgi:DNA-binding NarL/FixJ family response regulator
VAEEKRVVEVVTKTVRVVLVDDQESFRSAARWVLKVTDGFDLVGEAGSGEEGVALAAAGAADLVLMDIGLPGIDGLEATRRLLERDGRVRVIVLSTYEAAEYEAKALTAGAIGFISKSDFGPDVLRALWDRVTTG